MSDLEALLVSVRANPEDNTVRLAYADALEEYAHAHPRTCVCPSCRGGKVSSPAATGLEGRDTLACEGCDGAGVVPDRSLEARAEFIRVQIELLTSPRRVTSRVHFLDGSSRDEDVPVPRYGQLVLRERELRREYGERWERLACVECGGTGRVSHPAKPPAGNSNKGTRDRPAVTITQRCVHCFEGNLLTCPACRGAGCFRVNDIGDHEDCEWCEGTGRRKCHWRRGWPAVECHGHEVFDELLAYREDASRFVPTAWAAAVASWCDGFWLVDRQPRVHGGGIWWSHFQRSGFRFLPPDDRWYIPKMLYQLLRKNTGVDGWAAGREVNRTYDDTETANDDLACATFEAVMRERGGPQRIPHWECIPHWELLR